MSYFESCGVKSAAIFFAMCISTATSANARENDDAGSEGRVLRQPSSTRGSGNNIRRSGTGASDTFNSKFRGATGTSASTGSSSSGRSRTFPGAFQSVPTRTVIPAVAPERAGHVQQELPAQFGQPANSADASDTRFNGVSPELSLLRSEIASLRSELAAIRAEVNSEKNEILQPKSKATTKVATVEAASAQGSTESRLRMLEDQIIAIKKVLNTIPGVGIK